MSDLWEDLIAELENLDQVSPGGPPDRDVSATARGALEKSPPRSSQETVGKRQASLWPAEGFQPGVAEDAPVSCEKRSSSPETVLLSPLTPFPGDLPALMTSEDPDQNRHRWYAFSLQESFFGDLSVVCSWGGIGQKACGHKTWQVADEHDARKRISEMMAKRTSRGYRLLLPASGAGEARPRKRTA